MSKELIRRCDAMVVRKGKEEKCDKVAFENRGTEASLDGSATYEVDLCEEHRQPLVDAFALVEKYGTVKTTSEARLGVVPHASAPSGVAVVSPPGRSRVFQTANGTSFTTRDVREWLRANGRLTEAQARKGGQVKAADYDAYVAAHSA